ncbi:MAG: hypothetical protein PHI12_11870 [Dehalococcoidales bacterium]|nr:hypothetical protein [Dehalococcoidales bacterium]
MYDHECVNAVIENIRRCPSAWTFLERRDIDAFGFVVALRWENPDVTILVTLLVMPIKDKTLASLTVRHQGHITVIECNEEEATRMSQAVEHKVAVEKDAPHVAAEDVAAISLVTTLMKD